MTKKNSLFKNICLIMFSTIMLVLSIFSIFINVNARKTAFNVVHADTTTTNFYGSSFYVPINTYYYDMDYYWSLNTFNGFSSTTFRYVWSDGFDYYYSSGSNQYVLDISTNTWTVKTWNGITSFDGQYVWSDGTNYYYSSGSNQYVLDISTNTWTAKTWNGYTSFDGQYVWSDGTNYYYSSGGSQYVLDISTNTWTAKTWNGYLIINGNNVWSDGFDYYYSSGSNQYVLDISTNTWTAKTWNGYTSFNGRNIAVINGIVYIYSYVLDISTSTFLPMTWDSISSLNSIDGRDMFNVGDTYYYSNYKLDTTKHFIQDYNNTYFTSIAFTFIDNVTSYNLYANSVVYSYDTNCQLKYSIADKFVVSQYQPANSNFYLDVAKIYDTNNYVDYLSSGNSTSDSLPSYVLMPFEMFNSHNVKITACFIIQLSPDTTNFDLSFTSVQFDSYSALTQSDTLDYIANYCIYQNANWLFQISFYTHAYADTPVYYYADSSQVITYYLGFTDGRPTNDNYYFRFNPRTYYLTLDNLSGYDTGYAVGYNNGYNNGYSVGDSDGYSRGYNDGDTAGYSDGYDTGYDDGYDNGYEDGNTAGLTTGYNHGVNASHEYTFFNFIGAVIDAPISAIFGYIDNNPESSTYHTRVGGLLNFNLFGVNLTSFITSLITISIIIVIIKKVV